MPVEIRIVPRLCKGLMLKKGIQTHQSLRFTQNINPVSSLTVREISLTWKTENAHFCGLELSKLRRPALLELAEGYSFLPTDT